MTIYPKDFEQRIGFDKIRDAVSLLCNTQAARERVQAATFTTDLPTLRRLLGQTAEMRDILMLESDYPGATSTDINLYLRKIRIEGTHLDPAQMVDLQQALEQLAQLTRFFRAKRQEGSDPYPLLSDLTDPVEDFTPHQREINRLIDPDSGTLRDNASPELAQLRRTLREKAGQVDKRLQAILRQAQAAGLVDPDSEISVRDGRTVIPVAAVNKRKIKGLVHDESATGRTAYIEPIEVVELNNELRELENEERREIIRILTAFADRLRPDLPLLLAAGEYLVEMDFIQAKARYALSTDSVLPELDEAPRMHLRQARHPLLEATLRRENKPIVPLDLTLTPEKYILLISGPNAGGKSVCLKTAGLLQYMLQCGWLVPADSDTRMGLFDSLFIDIGDQQSLDNDLSTYSSHLINMKTLLRHANDRSLALIDEFGSGTEPGTGGAIAEAVLQKLEERHVWGIITTHYANLKYYAAGAQGIENGAMAFDLQNIRPLFRLEMGRPGSSFAFEIARKIGLPEEIIRSAETKIGSAQANAEKHIREAARDKRYWESKRERIRLAEKNIDRTAAQYELQLSEIQSEKAKILKEAPPRKRTPSNARCDSFANAKPGARSAKRVTPPNVPPSRPPVSPPSRARSNPVSTSASRDSKPSAKCCRCRAPTKRPSPSATLRPSWTNRASRSSPTPNTKRCSGTRPAPRPTPSATPTTTPPRNAASTSSNSSTSAACAQPKRCRRCRPSSTKRSCSVSRRSPSCTAKGPVH